MILLDTSFLIRSLVAGSAQDQQLRRWLADKAPIGISSIAWAGFLCGPVQPAMIEAVSGEFAVWRNPHAPCSLARTCSPQIPDHANTGAGRYS